MYCEFETNAYRHSGSCRALLLIALLLVCVFLLSLCAYGHYETMGEGSLTGELPEAVLTLRGFFEENEALAVLLGLPEDDAIQVGLETNDVAPHIREAADAYIREKQGR